MRTITPHFRALALALCLMGATATATEAAPFALEWWTTDVGGGVSRGGTFILTGTIAQPDATEPMTGGLFALRGGFALAPTEPPNAIATPWWLY